MVTAFTLLAKLHKEFGTAGCKQVWSHPYLYVVVRSPDLDQIRDEDDREDWLAQKLDISIAELRDASIRGFIRVEPLGTVDADPHFRAKGVSWLGLLSDTPAPTHPQPDGNPPNFLHFYGFKGGQGRTTILACLARHLADDGWRVLCVDFDAEAPSLGWMLGVAANSVQSTVMGLQARHPPVTPINAHVAASGGIVDVLPFRPSDDSFDYDAAALAFEFQGYSPGIEAAAGRLQETAARYDIVLLDHRTGLGAVVPALVSYFNGPMVFCARMDGQSHHARQAVRGLWRLTNVGPGLIVSAMPAGDDLEKFKARTRDEAEELLAVLSEAVEDDPDDPTSPQEFREHLIPWPYSDVLATSTPAQLAELPSEVVAALRAIRSRLGLSQIRQPPALPQIAPTSPRLLLDGSADEGEFITTAAARSLLVENSPIILVVGRKGTGKTRLARTMAERKLGEILLAPASFPVNLGGLRAGNADMGELISLTNSDPKRFWIALAAARVTSGPDSGQAEIVAQARKLLATGSELAVLRASLAGNLPRRRVLLVDALETAFSNDEASRFVPALFHVLRMIDATPDLSAGLRIVVFVRRDLLEFAIQDREQLEEGRRVDLKWDTQATFNFALSRILAQPWFRTKFYPQVQEIESKRPEILSNRLGENDAERLLLALFPPRLPFKKLLTATFLRTYFSDDAGNEEMYYPRVYMRFLSYLAENDAIDVETNRINARMIIDAHDRAAKDFLTEVRSELQIAAGVKDLDLAKILDALNEEKTPFDNRTLRERVVETTGCDEPIVKSVFDAMKRLGVLEEYPKRPHIWRPGRLFKTALGMKFNAGPAGRQNAEEL